MTCASCAARIERKLNKLDGVTASVNYATEKAAVEFDPAQVDAADAARRGRGRPATRRGSRSRRAATARGRPDGAPAPARRRRGGALASGTPHGDDPGAAVHVLAVGRARARDTGRPLGAAGRSTVAAWKNLRHGAATMDTLISLGTLAAWGWSVVALLPRPVTGCDAFDCASARGTTRSTSRSPRSSSTFLLAGRYFEARAKRSAGSALRALARARRQGRSDPRARRQRAARPDRRARARRPLRRPPRRESGDRRRRRRGPLGDRPVVADGREHPGRDRRRVERRGRDGQRRRPRSSSGPSASAPRPRSRRSRSSSAARRAERRPCSGSPTASPRSSCRS